MSRAGGGLFGDGDLDEVAVYDRPLSAATISEHYQSSGTNRRPVAAFSATPNPAGINSAVTFNGSASSDPDGTMKRYEWDLDGNGSYETDSGTSATTQRSYSHRAEHRRQAARHRQPVRHRHRDPRAQDRQPGARRRVQRDAESGHRGAGRRLQRLGHDRRRRHHRQVRVGPRRQRQLRDRHRHHQDDVARLHPDRHGQRRPARHRQRRLDVDGRRAGDDQRRRRQQLRRRRARHVRPGRLLAHGRGRRPDLRRLEGHEPRDRVRRHRPSASPAASRATPTRPGASTA